MNTLVNLAVTNALTVLPLAAVVFLLARMVRNAAVKHMLWVLVLVKFIAPPVFSLPVTVEWPHVEEAAPVDRAINSAPTPSTQSAVEVAVAMPAAKPSSATPAAELPASASVREPGTGAEPARPAPATAWTARVVRTWLRAWQSHPNWQTALLLAWIAGTVGWTALQMMRAFRFERMIASCPCVPTRLQQQTDALAADLGLKRGPRVFVIDAAVSPMLWGCGRTAKLLFPADLALRLDDEARATLITHELAHYSRGDHVVRVLELVATALFWWHPVLWWARAQIEQAEEECCDAWVVRQFPHVPRRYAEALLDTIDFLCEARRALPPLASGLGQAPFLRRRLTQIMQGPHTQPVTQRVRYAILLVAAVVLPLQPFAFATPRLATARLKSLPEIAATSLIESAEPQGISGDADREPPVEPTASPSQTPLPPRQPAPRTRSVRQGEVWSTAVSPDGRFMVRTTTARRVLLTDFQQNTSTDLSDQNITAVAFAPDAPWFAAAGSDGRIAIWNSITGKLQRVLDRHPNSLRTVAIAPDARTLAVGGVDGSVLVYDLQSDQLILDATRSAAAVNCIRFSPNGRQFAVAQGDWMSGQRGRVVVCDVTGGQILATLNCDAAPGALAFASDEELIIGLFEGHAQLWNLATRRVVAESWTDKGVIATAAFSPDNPVLREIAFSSVDPAQSERNTPLSLLRGFLNSQE
ncbi:MAG TPA: M56 family metallopeptidase [Planctomycetaceae bacterium]|nr:M56 family metallopeptidase [Planctomycetaceae bacterium]